MANRVLIKSLNKGPGNKRFVFKPFAQQVDEVDVDVFRSLAPIKFEPSEGSSFFQETLVRWREMNSAADFIAMCDEILPNVQTLPQLLLHKDLILNKLLSCLNMKCLLSLEPILSLVAILSRDLRADFIPYIPQILDAFVDLFKAGGDRDPNVIEQIWTSFSYILKYLQKHLTKDILFIMKATKKIRYYHRSYIQEFATEAVSYLLRNADLKQIIKGIRKLFAEAVGNPSEDTLGSCSCLLWYTLKGPSSALHSRAEPVLRLLLDESTFTSSKHKDPGEIHLKVLEGTFRRICEEVAPEKSGLLWCCIIEELRLCMNKSHERGDSQIDRKQMAHLHRILSLLNGILEYRRGSQVTDFSPLFDLASELLQYFNLHLDELNQLALNQAISLASDETQQNYSIFNENLRFILALVKSNGQVSSANSGPIAIAKAAPSWESIWKYPSLTCLIPFLKQLLKQYVSVIYPFMPYILRTLEKHISSYTLDVLPLLMNLFDKMGMVPNQLELLAMEHHQVFQSLSSFILNLIEEATRKLESTEGDPTHSKDLLSNPSVVWAALKCYPFLFLFEKEKPQSVNSCLVFKYAVALDKSILHQASDKELDLADSKKLQDILLGTALLSASRVVPLLSVSDKAALTQTFLDFAKRHRHSPSILKATAEILDDALSISTDMEVAALLAKGSLEALQLFSVNLGSRSKLLRLSTLRLLARYLDSRIDPLEANGGDQKRRKGNDGGPCYKEQMDSSNIFEMLLEIEAMPLGLDTSRKSSLLLTKLKVAICTGRVPQKCLIPITLSIIGMLYNQFTLLWDPASDCLVGLLERNDVSVWDTFHDYLESCQREFFELKAMIRSKEQEGYNGASQDLWSQFENSLKESEAITDAGTLLKLLLQVAKRVPQVAESKSRQLVPLFLSFLGYPDFESEKCHDQCSGKDWKLILKEWLALLKEMKNARSFFKGAILKEILLNRILVDNDTEVQLKCFECLLNWKDNYLIPYEQNLRNLISPKLLREELTTWNISRESQKIEVEHRDDVIPVILRMLFPKIMKTKNKAVKKTAVGVQRSAVLSFLAHLEPKELSLFFILLLKPLETAFNRSGLETIGGRTRWEMVFENDATGDFIDFIDLHRMATISYKRKTGFLHMAWDMLKTFNAECIGPYLHGLLAFVFKILESCSHVSDEKITYQEVSDVTRVLAPKSQTDINKEGLNGAPLLESNVAESDDELMNMQHNSDAGDNQNSSNEKTEDDEMLDSHLTEMKTMPATGAKELRSLAFKVLTIVFTKFEDLDFNPLYWSIFFSTIKPFINQFGQEAASSDKPSALFSCILAMSRSSFLAPVLKEEECIVPNVVSLLSNRNASLSIVGATLCFIENILNLEKEMDISANAEMVTELLLPHLSVILSSVRDLLAAYKEQYKGKRKRSLKRELHILSCLSRYIKDPAEVVEVVDVLLPFLALSKHTKADECLEVFSAITDLLPLLNEKSCKKILPFMSPLLASASHQDVRIAVCQCLEGMSKIDSSLSVAAGLISDMNSMSRCTIGEFDYDRRLNACGQLSSTVFASLSCSQASLIISNAVYYLSSEDMSIRGSSSQCLQAFLDFASTVYLRKEKPFSNFPSSPSEADTEIDFSTHEHWSPESIHAIVQKLLLPQIRQAMGSQTLTIRREWTNLLQQMVTKLKDGPILSEYMPLISPDPEVDFFNNIHHLQVHRRIKAMARFRTLCSSGVFSQGSLVRIFVPLFMNALFDAKGVNDGNLVGSAIETISCIAFNLQWDPYFSLLMHVFKLLATKPQHEKLLVRLLCGIVDKFHFYEERQEGKVFLEAPRGALESDTAEKPCMPADIQRRLQTRLLPEFTKLLISNKDMVNMSVALALIRILNLLPEEVIELELPPIAQKIVNLLKNRSQAVRDEARATIVAMADLLGFRYLPFLVETLQDSLTRGYEVHVLVFTLNSILLKLMPSLKVGDIDSCLERLLSVLSNDIFGHASEEKEVEKLAFKMKESRKTRSFESVRMLARISTFRIHVNSLLKPVRDNLMRRSLSPKLKVKIQTFLKHLALGVHANPSVSLEELLVFVHGTVEESLREEELQGKKVGMPQLPKKEKRAGERPRVLQSLYFIAEFALRFLHHRLKGIKVDREDGAALAMLDPMVNLMRRCLSSSRYEGVQSLSMKCLRYLLRLPLSSIEEAGGEILKLVLAMAERFGNTEKPIAQSCFNLLVVVLKYVRSATLSEDQLRLLLHCPAFVNLESSTNHMGMVALKAVVDRKVLVPELYDTMNRVAHTLITSHSPQVRQHCSQILLRFLLDYPLGTRRLQQHLDFFVANISYEHATGREAALEMLHVIIVKFPQQLVEEQLETLLLPLVTQIVNDDASQVRAMVGTVLKVLMGKVRQRTLHKTTEFCFSWLQKERRHLWRAGVQLLGFIIEVMKGRFQQYIEATLSHTLTILNTSFEDEGDADLTEKPKSVTWQEPYFALLMVEKLLQEFRDTHILEKSKELWDVICSFLLHQHVWIRMVSCRLLAIYFSICSSTTVTSGLILLEPSRVLLLSAYLCEQLEFPFDDEVFAGQIVELLLALSLSVKSLGGGDDKPFSTWAEFVHPSDALGRARILKALNVLEFEKLTRRKGERKSLDNGEVHGEATTDEYDLLLPIFKKLEKICLEVRYTQTKAIFSWYIAVSTKLGAENFGVYLLSVLHPVYRVTESFAGKNVPGDLKARGEEVLNHLKEIVGTSIFIKVFTKVREAVRGNRDERKWALKLKALVDPEHHAKRKINLTSKRRAQKKFKIMGFKLGRRSFMRK